MPRLESKFWRIWKWLMAFKPFGLWWRWGLYWSFEMLWPLVFGPLGFVKNSYKLVYWAYLRRIKCKETRKKMTATFDLGCKRIIFRYYSHLVTFLNTNYSNNFFPQLNKPHCHVDASKLIAITENGIKTEDKEWEFDHIIFATGFQLFENYDWLTENNPEYKAYTTDHNNAAYNGVMQPYAPNYCVLLGPMTGLGHK